MPALAADGAALAATGMRRGEAANPYEIEARFPQLLSLPWVPLGP